MNHYCKLISCLHRAILLFCSIFYVSISFAQADKGQIRGIIIDAEELSPLISSTITLNILKDSAALNRTQSDKNGQFLIKNVNLGDSVRIRIQHTGYFSYDKTFLVNKTSFNLDTIKLYPIVKELDNIVIKSPTPSIVVRNDTTEFNVDSFDIEDDDMVEDMLKKLPGIELDENGNITFHGKPINKILIDGQEFFGGDPEMTLKKLPADIVAKIQVMDSKTRDQIFNQLIADGETKTLNIKLKPGLKVFGNANILTGTRNQLNANGMMNLFNDNKRVTVTGAYNSINKIGILPLSQGMMNSSKNLGFNYNGFANKKVNIGGSFSYGNTESRQESWRQRQQFFTSDSVFTTKSQYETENNSDNYRANINLEGNIDSTTNISFGLSYNSTQNSSANNSNQNTIENEKLKNSSVQQNTSLSQNKNLNANLFLGKRLNKKGRTVSMTIRGGFTDQISDMRNDADNTFFNINNGEKTEKLRQHIDNKTESKNFHIALSYIEPISKKLRFQLNHNLGIDQTHNERKTFNIDQQNFTEKYDSLYSNILHSNNQLQQTSASLIYGYKKWNVMTGLNVMRNEFERNNVGKNAINQEQRNLSPNVTASYNIKKGQQIRFSFNATNNNPTVEQVQPIVDNSNSLYIRKGNPDLKPSLTQNYNLTYNTAGTKNVMNFNLGYIPVHNSIVNAIYFDEYRRQISQYININGIYNLRGGVSYNQQNSKTSAAGRLGMNLNGNVARHVFFNTGTLLFSRNTNLRYNVTYNLGNSKKKHHFNTSTAISYSRNITPKDKSGLNSENISIAPRLEWTFTTKSKIIISTSYNLSYNYLKNNSRLNVPPKYLDHFFSNNITVPVTKKASLESHLSYRYNSRSPVSFNRNVYLWNLFASMKLFKNNKGQLRFSATDILNGNRDINRFIGPNFIEDVQSTRIRNYYSLQFSYNWSNMERKK